MMSLVNPPDLLIYLRSTIPNLVSQIQKRGREYEKSIRIDYLTGLNERYENWIADYKANLLIVDADKIKFGNKPEDFQQVTDQPVLHSSKIHRCRRRINREVKFA